MEKTAVQKLARVLRVLVIAVFACNILAFFFVPGMALTGSPNELMDELMKMTSYENPLEVPARLLIVFAMCWSPNVWAFSEKPYAAVIAGFLLLCGLCTAMILWQAKKVLDTILEGNPFQMQNAKALNRAAACCWVISGVALLRRIWWLWHDHSTAPFFTYNTLFIPAFLMAGLLFQVMSALFRQAAELKEDQDLTI